MKTFLYICIIVIIRYLYIFFIQPEFRALSFSIRVVPLFGEKYNRYNTAMRLYKRMVAKKTKQIPSFGGQNTRSLHGKGKFLGTYPNRMPVMCSSSSTVITYNIISHQSHTRRIHTILLASCQRVLLFNIIVLDNLYIFFYSESTATYISPLSKYKFKYSLYYVLHRTRAMPCVMEIRIKQFRFCLIPIQEVYACLTNNMWSFQ